SNGHEHTSCIRSLWPNPAGRGSARGTSLLLHPHGRLQPVLHLVRHPLLDRHAWYPAIYRSAHNAGGSTAANTGRRDGGSDRRGTWDSLLQPNIPKPAATTSQQRLRGTH